ncbi:MAG: GNAT family N-acetyltransferase [Elusimicrobia bacterium CG08_land_8_20_14_0_20_51_18]|nr:MAG: GNAT family N-acetyltransferase [Elusimicrobia bacterium CG08_land_8_20_14_0_20_51_18]
MADMLVKLYDLENFDCAGLEKSGIFIKRAIAPEKETVTSWVKKNFSPSWVSECDVALSQVPSKCFLAVKNGKILGFACYDATCRGFFGPIGVLGSRRKTGVGKALLLKTLEQMRNDGYGYAAIGWAGPVDFFKRTAKAVLIEGSEPGVYRNMIKKQKDAKSKE